MMCTNKETIENAAASAEMERFICLEKANAQSYTYDNDGMLNFCY